MVVCSVVVCNVVICADTEACHGETAAYDGDMVACGEAHRQLKQQ